MSQLTEVKRKAKTTHDKLTSVIAVVGAVGAFIYDTFNEGR